MFRLCLLLLPLFLTACGDQRSRPEVAAQSESDTASESDAAPAGNFYKRFNGTIGGKSVTMHLQRVAGKIQGAYQYDAIGQSIMLRNWTDTIADEEFIFTERAPGVQGEGAMMSITIRGRNAIGSWHSSDGTQHFPIVLRENYPEGSVALAAYYVSDSASLSPEMPSSPKATVSYSYMLPARSAPGFLYKVLIAQIAPEGNGGGDVAAAIRSMNEKYFMDYRKDNAFLLDDLNSDASLFAFGYSREVVMNVRYNDQFWLITELFHSSYTGGAHGNYGSGFANIDRQLQHVWKLTDIVTDTSALRPMLNDAAIRYFSAKPASGVGSRIMVSEVPPTMNVYISQKGLTFVYNPYEIASYADGQISLFIPYNKLMPYLTPAFKGRMNLSGRAGVAMLFLTINSQALS